jgi:hypothetical protein
MTMNEDEIIADLRKTPTTGSGLQKTILRLEDQAGFSSDNFVPLVRVIGEHAIRFWVAPDYFCLQRVVVPLTPETARTIGKIYDWVLPTPKLVDLIYQMGVAVPAYSSKGRDFKAVFEINDKCQAYIEQWNPRPALVVGHRKDVVTCKAAVVKPEFVAIYGWHGLSGKPIQPLYTGHSRDYYDYSHGVRFIRNACEVDGQPKLITDLYSDPALSPMVAVNPFKYRF